MKKRWMARVLGAVLALGMLMAGPGIAAEEPEADSVVTLRAERAGQELTVTLGVNRVTFNALQLYVAYDKTRLTPAAEPTEYLQPEYDAFTAPEGWMSPSAALDEENGVIRYVVMASGEAGGSVLDGDGFFTAGSTDVNLLKMKFTVKDGATLYADSIKLGKSASAPNGIVIATKNDDGIEHAGAVLVVMGAAAESSPTPGGTGEGYFGKKPDAPESGGNAGGGSNGGGSGDTGGNSETPSTTPPAMPGGAADFSDTAAHWAKNSIETLVSRGIVNGYADGTFRPEAHLTRAEFAAVLARAKKLDTGADEGAFADCAGTWSEPYVNAAYRAGYVNGTGESMFSPEQDITREEIVTIIARAEDLSGGEALTFRDAAQIAPWARESVTAAVRQGVVSGYPDGTFRPRAGVTRGEMAKMVETMLD